MATKTASSFHLEPSHLLDHFSHTGFVRLAHIVGDRDRGIPAIIPISKSTLWSWVKAGKFPAPTKLGPRTTAWRASDVLAWVESREGGGS